MALQVRGIHGPYTALVGQQAVFTCVEFNEKSPKPKSLNAISWQVSSGDTVLLTQHEIGPELKFFPPPVWAGLSVRIRAYVGQASKGAVADLQIAAPDEQKLAHDGAEASILVPTAVMAPKVVTVVTDLTTFAKGKDVIAKVDGVDVFVGDMTRYPIDGDAPPVYRGLARAARTGDPGFDAAGGRALYGIWSDIAGIVAKAESGGSLLAVNTWDRAYFTFGHMQWGAHEVGANFALLFRQLLKLPTAPAWFPDLRVVQDAKLGEQITQMTAAGPKNLEIGEQLEWWSWSSSDATDAAGVKTKTWNSKKNSGVVAKGLMTYFNPSPHEIDATEVINSAKMIAWVSREPDARRVVEAFTVKYMRQAFNGYSFKKTLDGKSAAVCAMVFEAMHQGRSKGLAALIKEADPYKAMYDAGLATDYKTRVETVHKGIEALLADAAFKSATYSVASNDFVPA